MTPRRSATAILLPLVLLAGCYGGQTGASPSAGYSEPANATVAPQRTQNRPSRGPGPTNVVITLPPASPEPTSSRIPAVTARPTAPPDPKLLAMLPTTIGGRDLQVVSGRASDIGTGGDMCWVFCPGELQETAKNAGADPDDVTWAVAQGDFAPDGGVFIRAIRIPGATSDRILAWVTETPTLVFPEISQIRVEGRRVTLIQSAFSESPPAYAFVSGNVLFVVVASPIPADPQQPDGLALEAIRLLP